MKSKSKKLEAPKHPLFIRWTHWVNFPILFVMIWSGGMIYWANHVYWPHFSDEFFKSLNLKYRLAEGMSYHFFFAWIFAINGILYFLYLLFSGEWRELFPKRDTVKRAFDVFLHDLGFKKIKIPPGKFNAAQRIAYTTILFMGFGSLITGLAIYKPVQLNWLKNILGGYETARLLHFYLTVGFILFFFIHVAQVVKSGWKHFRAMVTGNEERKSFGSFAILIFGLTAFVLAFSWLVNLAPRVDEVPAPLRSVLELNEKIWISLLNPSKDDGLHSPPPPFGSRARVNGEIGLNDEDDLKNWKITISTPMTQLPPREIQIPLEEIRKLPHVDQVSQLKCIEGWSEIRAYGGVRFIDFMNQFHLGTHSGGPVDFKNHPEDLFSYVGFETPDEEYYVSIDMRSLLSPEALLAFELNGLPLSVKNGAPVRLALANKYGVKNLKRIGRIQFSDTKLPDYWGEQGYDWFIGL